MSDMHDVSLAIQTALLEMPEGCFANGRESSICEFIPCACMDVAAKAVLTKLSKEKPPAEAEGEAQGS